MDFLDKQRYLSELADLDWDFTGQPTDTSFAQFHWHPARFVPQVPGIIIGTLSDPGDRVIDPFCGSGTALVEAMVQGREAVGIDTSAIAALMSRAKTSAFDVTKFEAYEREILGAIDVALGASGAELSEVAGIPNLDEQRLWYHPRTLAELAAVWRVIHTSDATHRCVSLACFSAVLKAVCSQDKHWGWVCDNVRPTQLRYRDAVAAFGAKMREYRAAAATVAVRRVGRASVTVKQGRCATILGEYDGESFDLAVTSPPYLGVTDYAKSQRLSYLWFDLPVEHDRQIETGARSKRWRRSARAEFMEEMRQSFAQIARVLKRGGYCAVVAGESPARDTYVAELELLIESCGLRIAERIERRLPNQRGIVATLRHERLLVCCRD
jgi:hypothetical protein